MDILSDVSVSGKLVAQKICATGQGSRFDDLRTKYLYIDGGLTIKRDLYCTNWFNFEPRIRTTEIAVNRISRYPSLYGNAIYLGNSQEDIIVCGVLQEPSGDKFAIKRRSQISVPESCLKFYVGEMYDGLLPIVTAWDTTSKKRIELDYGYAECTTQFYAQRTNSEALCLTFYYV